MASIFEDLLGGFLGQQEIPTANIPNAADIYGQAFSATPTLAQGAIDWNNALAPGLFQTQLGIERLYDPNQAALRQATTSSILNQLNMGSDLPQDVQNAVVRNALEGNAASGFGVGQGGRGLVARDLGLTSLDLLNQRQNAALGAVRSAPSLSSLYQPQVPFSPGDVANMILGNAAAQNQYDTFAAGLRSQNRANMIDKPVSLISNAVGTAAGAMFGTSGFGSLLKGAGGAGGMGSAASSFAPAASGGFNTSLSYL